MVLGGEDGHIIFNGFSRYYAFTYSPSTRYKMKVCSSCGLEKSINSFYQNKGNKDNHTYNCKDCEKIKANERWTIIRRKFNGLYGIWVSMKNRCYNSKIPAFKWYGKRGIIVCGKWRHSFKDFYEWAKDKRKKGLTIDRINNDGNYCPENCRFVTMKVNNRNNSYTKLNPDKVKKIRILCQEGKLPQHKIGKLFGVKQRVISNINRREVWKDV